MSDSMVHRCAGLKKNGEGCSATVVAPQKYCWLHDPANAEARKANASKAAKSKVSAELSSIKARLKELAEDVASGELNTTQGSVAGQLYGWVLKTIEQERKQLELQEVKRELEEVRELYEQQKVQANRGGGSWWTG